MSEPEAPSPGQPGRSRAILWACVIGALVSSLASAGLAGGLYQATGERGGRSSWRPGSPGKYRTTRTAGGNRSNGTNGIHRSVGAIGTVRSSRLVTGYSLRLRRILLSGHRCLPSPVSFRDIPLERWCDSVHHLRISVRRQLQSSAPAAAPRGMPDPS